MDPAPLPQPNTITNSLYPKDIKFLIPKKKDIFNADLSESLNITTCTVKYTVTIQNLARNLSFGDLTIVSPDSSERYNDMLNLPEK